MILATAHEGREGHEVRQVEYSIPNLGPPQSSPIGRRYDFPVRSILNYSVGFIRQKSYYVVGVKAKSAVGSIDR